MTSKIAELLIDITCYCTFLNIHENFLTKPPDKIIYFMSLCNVLYDWLILSNFIDFHLSFI
jgi:hypothetical protein